MKRLLIVESGFFVGEIIHDFLKDRCESMEVHTLFQAKVTEINRAIVDFQPDIVMVDDTSPEEVMRAIFLLTRSLPNLRVVILCADSNRVQVFDARRLEVESMEDFLAVL